MVSFAIIRWWFSERRTSYRHSGALPGDNPVYEEMITSTTPQNATDNIIITNKSFNRDMSESAPNREFDNPIYGKEERQNVYSVPDLDTYQIVTGSTPYHKFDNPIYGDETTYSS